MIPTLEAQRLIPEIRELYGRLQAIGVLTEQLRRGEGQTVRVGAAHAFGQMILAPAMVEYRRQNGFVNVDLVTEHFSTLCQNLLEDRLDFALVFGQQVQENWYQSRCFTRQWWPCCRRIQSRPRRSRSNGYARTIC